MTIRNELAVKELLKRGTPNLVPYGGKRAVVGESKKGQSRIRHLTPVRDKK